MSTILEALQALSARDQDRASENNGIGFNGRDTDFGNSLAQRSFLTENQQRAALKMLAKYRVQLQKYGIDYGSLQVAHQSAPVIPQNGIQSNVFPTAGSVAQVRVNPRKATLKGNSIVFSFPYDMSVKDELKTKFKSARFDGMTKTWSIVATDIQSAIQFCEFWHFDHTDLSYALISSQNDARAAQDAQELAYQSRLLPIMDLLSGSLPDGRKLYPYQVEDIKRILHDRNIINAIDMGLGKTLEALVSAKAYVAEGYKVFVVCPVSPKDNWLMEAATVQCPIEVFSWAKIPTAPEHTKFILIADEAHYAQNLKSQRTEKLLALADKAEAVILLTGTPIKNGRPVNLFPLLKAVGHSLAKDKKNYEVRYCGARATRFTLWDTTGSTHLEELNAEIQNVMLRRMKKDVLLDLPEKTRIFKKAELSTEAERTYQITLARLQSEYQERKRTGKIQDGGEALVLLNQLRHAGSIAKIESAIEIAEEILSQKEQIVIFCEFQESVVEIAKALNPYGCSIITGDTPNNSRQLQVDNFQFGHNKVFIGTIKAGGVGLTLTASSTVLAVDRPWTPGDILQAEDRVHRISQKNAVTALWLQANGCDEKIDRILDAKARNIGAILGEESAINYVDLADDILG